MRGSAGRALARLIRSHPLAAFLLWFFTVGQVLAFVPVLGRANGLDLPIEPFTSASTIVGLLLPAVVITWMTEGADGLRHLWRRTTVLHAAPRWYALALVVVPSLALAVGSLLYGVPVHRSLTAVASAVTGGLLLQGLVHLVTNNLWEEVAWMGFVQARLQHRHTPMTAVVITAPFVALQHLALVVDSSPLGAVLVVMALLLLAFPYRAVMALIYNRTGSLFLAGVAHAAGDAVATGSSLGEGLLPRLYEHPVGPVHLFAFAILGLVVMVATRGRLGSTTAVTPTPSTTSSTRHSTADTPRNAGRK